MGRRCEQKLTEIRFTYANSYMKKFSDHWPSKIGKDKK